MYICMWVCVNLYTYINHLPPQALCFGLARYGPRVPARLELRCALVASRGADTHGLVRHFGCRRFSGQYSIHAYMYMYVDTYMYINIKYIDRGAGTHGLIRYLGCR